MADVATDIRTDWVTVNLEKNGDDVVGITARLAIPGGNLYRFAAIEPLDPQDDIEPTVTAVALVFVPSEAERLRH